MKKIENPNRQEHTLKKNLLRILPLSTRLDSLMNPAHQNNNTIWKWIKREPLFLLFSFFSRSVRNFLFFCLILKMNSLWAMEMGKEAFMDTDILNTPYKTPSSPNPQPQKKVKGHRVIPMVNLDKVSCLPLQIGTTNDNASIQSNNVGMKKSIQIERIDDPASLSVLPRWSETNDRQTRKMVFKLMFSSIAEDNQNVRVKYLLEIFPLLSGTNKEVRQHALKTMRVVLKDRVPQTWKIFCQQVFPKLGNADLGVRRSTLKVIRELLRIQNDDVWAACLPSLAAQLGNEDKYVREAAQLILAQHNLIAGKTSHKILRAIKDNIPLHTLNLPYGIKLEQLEHLKLQYKKKKEEIENQNQTGKYPSNLPFYLILREKHPDFAWSICDRTVRLKTPCMGGLQPSLLSLLITDTKSAPNPYLDLYIFSPLPTFLSSDFVNLLGNLQAQQPSTRSIARIVKWLEAGLQGKPLTLISFVCPDYSVEMQGNGLYRYTFNELGSGVGLLAKRFLSIVPTLNDFFQNHALPVKIEVALGDFEALSESNLQRVHLTFGEFLDRLKKSQVAIQQSSPIPMKVSMITDLCGGVDAWNTYLQNYKGLLAKKEFGHSKLNDDKLIKIVKARKPLYDRWLGERPTLKDYLPQLLEQGAEYAAMGAIIAEKFTNCLILGVDQPVMRHFYDVNQPHPMLYLRPCYQ